MTKFILCCLTSDLSDNLTEMCILKNSITLFPLLPPSYFKTGVQKKVMQKLLSCIINVFIRNNFFNIYNRSMFKSCNLLTKHEFLLILCYFWLFYSSHMVSKMHLLSTQFPSLISCWKWTIKGHSSYNWRSMGLKSNMAHISWRILNFNFVVDTIFDLSS